MATTEAQKRARAKYERENYKTLAIKLSVQEIEMFKEALDRNGETKYKVLKGFILDYIEKSQ